MDWQRNITAASGYLDLGMGQEAWDELDSMPPEDRARSEVVVMRLVILQSMERWDKAEIEGLGSSSGMQTAAFSGSAEFFDLTRWTGNDTHQQRAATSTSVWARRRELDHVVGFASLCFVFNYNDCQVGGFHPCLTTHVI